MFLLTYNVRTWRRAHCVGIDGGGHTRRTSIAAVGFRFAVNEHAVWVHAGPFAGMGIRSVYFCCQKVCVV